MDPQEGRELPSAGELDEETIARKRSRRVSFAETTAVHVFDRDEDYETPPDSTRGTAESGADGEVVGLRGDISDSDDSRGSVREEEEDDDEDDGEQERFVRDMDSSPGSAVGSMTSNDDDNFFGPVSTSFIRSMSLSEAEMSDGNNHDITLDSTAFSLHFRNIAPLDDRTANSVRSLMTPTEVAAPDNNASISVPMGFKKPFVHGKLFAADPSGSAGGSSNMSLVEDKSKRYDYGQLSPTLDKLLNEVDKSMQPKSPSSSIKVVVVGSHSSEALEPKESGDNATHLAKEAVLDATCNHHFDSHVVESSVKDIAAKLIVNGNPPEESLQLDTLISKKAEGTARTIEISNHDDDHEATMSDIVVAAQKIDMLSPLHQGSRTNSPFQSNHICHAFHKDQLSGNKHSSIISPQSQKVVPPLVMEDGQQQNQQPEFGIYTPKCSPKFLQAPLLGSVSSLRAKRQQLFLDPAVSSQSKLINNSAKEQPPSSLELVLTRHGERISAIKNHISKFRITGPPDLDNFQSVMPFKGSVPLDLEGAFTKEADISKENCVSVSVTNLEEKSPNSAQKKGAHGERISAIKNHISKFRITETPDLDNFQSGMPFKGSIPLELEGAFAKEADISKENSVSVSVTNLEAGIPNSAQKMGAQAHIVESNDSRFNAVEPTHVDAETNIFKESSKAPSNLGSGQEIAIVEDGLAGKKRRIRQHLVTDASHINKISRIENSPKISSELVANIPVVCPSHHSEITDESLEICGQSTVKHWSDTLSEVSGAIKVVFSPTIHKLTFQELDMLENILGELQIARKYLKISTSLTNNSRLVDLHQQRVNEVRLLHDNILYEKAKLQIKHAKLDQLHNKTQLAQSGLQECQSLKSLFSQIFSRSTRTLQNKENHDHQVSSISSCQNQGERESVGPMKQELKILEQKVGFLLKSLEVCCKMKGNMNIDGIIKVANEHLEMRTRISNVRQHLQIWKLSDIAKRVNQHEIVLNYCSLLFQRFTIHPGQISSTIVSNTISEANIEKIFRHMNACVAFEFVFSGKEDGRVASSKCFRQKTLETSLIMGTLLDVLDEVRVAGMEILNLTLSTFVRSATGQLELELCFTNFKNGWKVMLSIDLSELKCGVYPSDPSELKCKICEMQTTLPSALSSRMIAALKRMQGDRLVILRLCRSISKLVQVSAI